MPTTIYSVWCEEYEEYCQSNERCGEKSVTKSEFMKERATFQFALDQVNEVETMLSLTPHS